MHNNVVALYVYVWDKEVRPVRSNNANEETKEKRIPKRRRRTT
jgi:hypothetical protein